MLVNCSWKKRFFSGLRSLASAAPSGSRSCPKGRVVFLMSNISSTWQGPHCVAANWWGRKGLIAMSPKFMNSLAQAEVFHII